MKNWLTVQQNNFIKLWKIYRSHNYSSWKNEKNKVKFQSQTLITTNFLFSQVLIFSIVDHFRKDKHFREQNILSFIFLMVHFLCQVIFYLTHKFCKRQTFRISIQIICSFIMQLEIIYYIEQYTIMNQEFIYGVIVFFLVGTNIFNVISFFIVLSTFLISFRRIGIEYLFLEAFLYLYYIILKEIECITSYTKFSILINILDQFPNAMCIVNEEKTNILFSNEQFNKLANILPNDQITDQDQLRKQILFLKSLNMIQINKENFSLFKNLNENQHFNEPYKIKKVVFENKNVNEFQLAIENNVFVQRLKNNSFISSIKQQQKNQVTSESVFKNYQYFQHNQMKHNSYTSEITLLMDLSYDASSIIQSAKKKQQKNQLPSSRKISIYASMQKKQISEFQTKRADSKFILIPSQRESRNSQKNEIELDLNSNRFDERVTQIEQKMKLMIDELESVDLINCKEKLKIMFLSDMTPYLLKNQIEKLQQLKKNLMRSISHELLTYLNGAYGYMYQIQNEMNRKMDMKTFRKWSELAFKYIVLQMHKIQDLIDYRDIINDEFKISSETFPLSETITECIDLIRDQIEQKGLYLNLQSYEQNIDARGDKQKFTQLMLNLLSNAIKYTNKGGIDIQISKIENLQDHFNVGSSYQIITEPDPVLEIKIQDSGIGMPPEALGRLQKKLLLVDSEEKVSKESVGIGMGLVVCREIIKKMGPQGGEINRLFSDSKEAEGTEFKFYLISRNFNARKEQKKKSMFFKSPGESPSPSINLEYKVDEVRVSSYRFNQPRIMLHHQIGFEPSLEVLQNCSCNQVLIVDDESFNLDVLEYQMKNFRFEIEKAYNGKEAFEKYEAKYGQKCSMLCKIYKVILMDLNMPVMTGWEAVQKIRKMEEDLEIQDNVRVIAVTAFCGQNEVKKCLDAGFNYLISKPATKNKLLEAFQTLKIDYDI